MNEQLTVLLTGDVTRYVRSLLLRADHDGCAFGLLAHDSPPVGARDDVLISSLGHVLAGATFALYRAWAKRAGLDGTECGSVVCVQCFGSLNLHVHFHVWVAGTLPTDAPRVARARDPIEPAPFSRRDVAVARRS